MNQTENNLSDNIISDSSQRIAAIDLGSNSFHMLLAESSDHGLKVFHREKRQVALAKGLDDNDNLSQESIETALQTLKMFSDILQQFQPDLVRIVGTYTFRTARNIKTLIDQAKTFLPYPIEIMSGTEEARLIFQGVSHNNVLKHNHLIVDIGGGSTEMIIGKDHTPLQLHSCNVGCVSLSDHYFSEGDITPAAFKKAIIFAEQQLDPIKRRYRKTGWKTVLGTSGTIKALSGFVCTNIDANGIITLDILYKIKQQLLSASNVSNIELPGVNEDRYGVICGGLATLIAVFETMKIDTMIYCDHALREGLVAEVEDRIHLSDVRDFSVSQLANRFNADIEQAFRVERDALQVYDRATAAWNFKDGIYRNLLRWACQLHEVGHQLNYHKANQHAHYIVSNASLAGFNQEQQEVLAYILLSQRKQLRPESLPELTHYKRKPIFKIILILRLAILVNRFRQEGDNSDVQLSFTKKGVDMQFGEEWRHGSELFQADLEKEQQRFANVDLNLTFSFS
ncbi:MAG: exopolyphosphatase [Candidatus Pelagadaptatus aseana]|uniref:Ppx/GppA phosphatase family protein n=1 Tax=Candidatus Pelagadaptatus aseana TaxID=3120508 RepID=UPI0039B2589D